MKRSRNSRSWIAIWGVIRIIVLVRAPGFLLPSRAIHGKAAAGKGTGEMARSGSARLVRRLALPVLVTAVFAGLYVEAGDIAAALFPDAEDAPGHIGAAAATALWLCAAWLTKRAIEYVLVVVARARHVEFPRFFRTWAGSCCSPPPSWRSPPSSSTGP